MSVSNERLKQIERLREKIEEKNEWIKRKKEELEEKKKLVENVSCDLLELLSASASASTRSRDIGETTAIGETVERDDQIIDDLDDAIKEREKELNELEKEKEALEEAWGKGN